ncbi:MAG TPA: hypothetical protein VMH83_15920 [Candidatus Acidoferrum sp.]|nr:hypothetical protein [Candidatus Acidoferrum sp.]
MVKLFRGGLVAVLCAHGAPLLAADEAQAPHRYNPNIELPDSDGKALVLRSCTQCHELAGLAAYKGYWNRAKWKELVVGMVKHGAVLQPAEQDMVTDYLTKNFGPGTQQ